MVTSHNVPIAELAPLRGKRGTIQRMIDEGRATPAVGPMIFDPIDLSDYGITMTASDALEYVRGED